MHVTIACLVTIFQFWFPTLCVCSASDNHWGRKQWLRGYVRATQNW